MLWALPLVAVRQQHHETVLLTPFIFSSNDVLVDHDLSTVDEVAKLCFPCNKCVVVGMCVPVLETECAVFRQQRVVHPEIGFVGGKFSKRNPVPLVFIVDECSVTLTECSTTRVFTSEAHACAFKQQRTNGECFTNCPFHFTFFAEGLFAQLKLLCKFGVRCESFGVLRELGKNGFDDRSIDTGIDVRNHTCRQRWLRCLNGCWSMCTCFIERRLQLALVVEKMLFCLVDRDVATLHECFYIHLA